MSGHTFTPLYHVPRSQVWEGSGGRQSGKVHLHARESVTLGRIRRDAGQSLCGRRGWYERPAELGEAFCPRCWKISLRGAGGETSGAAGE